MAQEDVTIRLNLETGNLQEEGNKAIQKLDDLFSGVNLGDTIAKDLRGGLEKVSRFFNDAFKVDAEFLNNLGSANDEIVRMQRLLQAVVLTVDDVQFKADTDTFTVGLRKILEQAEKVGKEFAQWDKYLDETLSLEERDLELKIKIDRQEAVNEFKELQRFFRDRPFSIRIDVPETAQEFAEVSTLFSKIRTEVKALESEVGDFNALMRETENLLFGRLEKGFDVFTKALRKSGSAADQVNRDIGILIKTFSEINNAGILSDTQGVGNIDAIATSYKGLGEQLNAIKEIYLGIDFVAGNSSKDIEKNSKLRIEALRAEEKLGRVLLQQQLKLAEARRKARPIFGSNESGRVGGTSDGRGGQDLFQTVNQLLSFDTAGRNAEELSLALDNILKKIRDFSTVGGESNKPDKFLVDLREKAAELQKALAGLNDAVPNFAREQRNQEAFNSALEQLIGSTERYSELLTKNQANRGEYDDADLRQFLASQAELNSILDKSEEFLNSNSAALDNYDARLEASVRRARERAEAEKVFARALEASEKALSDFTATNEREELALANKQQSREIEDELDSYTNLLKETADANQSALDKQIKDSEEWWRTVTGYYDLVQKKQEQYLKFVRGTETSGPVGLPGIQQQALQQTNQQPVVTPRRDAIPASSAIILRDAAVEQANFEREILEASIKVLDATKAVNREITVQKGLAFDLVSASQEALQIDKERLTTIRGIRRVISDATAALESQPIGSDAFNVEAIKIYRANLDDIERQFKQIKAETTALTPKEAIDRARKLAEEVEKIPALAKVAGEFVSTLASRFGEGTDAANELNQILDSINQKAEETAEQLGEFDRLANSLNDLRAEDLPFDVAVEAIRDLRQEFDGIPAAIKLIDQAAELLLSRLDANTDTARELREILGQAGSQGIGYGDIRSSQDFDQFIKQQEEILKTAPIGSPEFLRAAVDKAFADLDKIDRLGVAWKGAAQGVSQYFNALVQQGGSPDAAVGKIISDFPDSLAGLQEAQKKLRSIGGVLPADQVDNAKAIAAGLREIERRIAALNVATTEGKEKFQNLFDAGFITKLEQIGRGFEANRAAIAAGTASLADYAAVAQGLTQQINQTSVSSPGLADLVSDEAINKVQKLDAELKVAIGTIRGLEGIDIGPLVKQVEESAEAVKGLGDGGRDAVPALRKARDELKKLGATEGDLKNINQIIQESSASLEVADASASELQEQFNKLNNELKSVERGSDRYRKALRELVEVQAKLKRETALTEDALDRQSAEYLSSRIAASSFEKVLEDLKNELGEGNAGLEERIRLLEALERQIRENTGANISFGASEDQVSQARRDLQLQRNRNEIPRQTVEFLNIPLLGKQVGQAVSKGIREGLASQGNLFQRLGRAAVGPARRLQGIPDIQRQGLSEALIGGAFPLLFGQGPLAAGGGFLGGILGPALLGSGGGFAGGLVFTALGQGLQNATDAATQLSKALEDPIANFQQLADAAVFSSKAVEGLVAGLIATGRNAEARAAIEVDLLSNTPALNSRRFAEITDANAREFSELQLKIGEALGPRGILGALAGFFNSIQSFGKGGPNREEVDFANLSQVQAEIVESSIEDLSALEAQLVRVNTLSDSRKQLNDAILAIEKQNLEIVKLRAQEKTAVSEKERAKLAVQILDAEQKITAEIDRRVAAAAARADKVEGEIKRAAEATNIVADAFKELELDTNIDPQIFKEVEDSLKESDSLAKASLDTESNRIKFLEAQKSEREAIAKLQREGTEGAARELKDAQRLTAIAQGSYKIARDVERELKAGIEFRRIEAGRIAKITEASRTKELKLAREIALLDKQGSERRLQRAEGDAARSAGAQTSAGFVDTSAADNYEETLDRLSKANAASAREYEEAREKFNNSALRAELQFRRDGTINTEAALNASRELSIAREKFEKAQNEINAGIVNAGVEFNQLVVSAGEAVQQSISALGTSLLGLSDQESPVGQLIKQGVIDGFNSTDFRRNAFGQAEQLSLTGLADSVERGVKAGLLPEGASVNGLLGRNREGLQTRFAAIDQLNQAIQQQELLQSNVALVGALEETASKNKELNQSLQGLTQQILELKGIPEPKVYVDVFAGGGVVGQASNINGINDF